MQFNRYIFDLYLQSYSGQENLKVWTDFLDWENWEKLDYKKLSQAINSSLYLSLSEGNLKLSFSEIKKEVLEPLWHNFENPSDSTYKKITWKDYLERIENKFGFKTDSELIEDAKKFWENKVNALILGDKKDRDFISSVHWLSIYLSVLNPHLFFPYFFLSQFNLIENLFKEFDLILPTLPKVRDYKARLNYYFELCEILYYFRQEHKLQPADFLAFLYGFNGNFIKERLEINEKPLRVWLSLGSPDNYQELLKDKTEYYTWPSNLDAESGDLQLIYFWKISQIKAITQVISSGYFDPFLFYGNTSMIKIIKVLDEKEQGVSFKDLKDNPIWSKNGGVKMNMQISHSPQITPQEYQELKSILKEKGQNQDILPELEAVTFDLNLDFKSEKDVEIELLEPLLKKLGFTEKDWIRQLPLRMGRGQRNYPDYALFVNNQKQHEETAKFLWEAKFRIKNQKDLRDAFLQAKSYARRLNSLAFGLIAVEGVWVSTIKDGFEFEKLQKYSYKDLKEAASWSLIKNVFKQKR